MVLQIVLTVVIVVLVYELAVLLGVKFVSIMRRIRDARTDNMVISVRVSKENELGPIVAEQIFATIHGVYKKIPWRQKFLGRQNDRISFEIANIAGSIRFYIHFPQKLRNLIEGQIYAQYPDVEIEEVEDYSRRNTVEVIEQSDETALSVTEPKKGDYPAQGTEIDPFRYACGAELKLDDPHIYPVKRYPQFEDKLTRVAVDPLSGITATLSKLNHESDEAWVQLVVSPLSDRWRIVFVRAVKIVNTGFLSTFEWLQKMFLNIFCTRKTVYKFMFPPIYFILWLRSLKVKKAVPDGQQQQQSSSSGFDDEFEMVADARHDRETDVQAASDKVVKLLFETKIRVMYVPHNEDKETALVKVREIAGSFKQFNLPNVNGFGIERVEYGKAVLHNYQNRSLENSFVLNTEELATIYHMPSMTVMTPGIFWVRSKKLEPPLDLPEPKKLKEGESCTLLGKTNFRGTHKKFGIKTIDRRRHMYIIGKTGMGKSTLLENMLYSDIQNDKGVAIIDPHGDLAEAVLGFVPARRTNDVIVFDPSDRDFPVAFNMLENIDPAFNTIVASGLVGIFKKIYADSWGPRLEHILRNTILSLLEYPDTTMLGITRILQDHIFRRRVIRKITDPVVRSFWVNEFEQMQPRMRVEAISPILNKVGQFLSSPIVRNIVGQPKSSINLRHAMDNKKIVVVNLSKGKIGEDNSSLLGAMMITKFQLDAMSRASIPEDERVDFYLYVDEFQNFATDSFATILSEARKYKLNLNMANQYIAQMPDEVRDAVFGNVGTIFTFQVGFDDAEYLSQQYAEEVSTNDLVSLSKYTAYIRLLIDGMPSKTFSLDTLPPPHVQHSAARAAKVIRTARERYSRSREQVEDKIRRWSMNTEKKPDELEEGKDAKKSSDKKKQDKKPAAKKSPAKKNPPKNKK